ncbi:hypothetical protein H072_6627 [Dactylellina haptotyla CBS 200.50]|uniref:Uncharacterized protein n=1 Tax=Dactylellina haptotyla (strain CBS 200.50) TaxID=1284197 RepID=S8A963_DACHA|nr:hypothetical protein H072_6627 [Dactylellina haptotyla CBS 200.50]
MHSLILATALFSSVPFAAAHVRFLTAYGDANPSHHGASLGHRPDIPTAKYATQIPWQVDVTCFSSPLVPATKDSPYYAQKRKYFEQGCGATIYGIESYYNLGPTTYKTVAQRNKDYFMRPLVPGALTQTRKKTLALANSNKMAQATPGGYVEMVTWQVNDDGAGPFRCKLDESGTGQSFGSWLPGVHYDGGSAANSIYPATNFQHHKLRVPIPKNVNCQAQYGSYKNVCILRCENVAKNGPFGGCVPFQVMYPADKYNTGNGKYGNNNNNNNSDKNNNNKGGKKGGDKVVYGEPEKEVKYGDAGYDVGKDNYIERYGGDYKSSLKTRYKRDLEGKDARRARVADVEAALVEEAAGGVDM